MRVNQAFRFELDRQALARHVGAARQEWNRWKRENAPWWSGVSCAPQEAFRDLERALENWKAERARFPQWPVVNPLRGERDDDGLRNGQRPLNSDGGVWWPCSEGWCSCGAESHERRPHPAALLFRLWAGQGVFTVQTVLGELHALGLWHPPPDAGSCGLCRWCKF
jgi:hypothetical protein